MTRPSSVLGNISFTIVALVVGLPITAAAQGGFSIEGIVPDGGPGPIVQVLDGSGNAQEIGPVNGNSTKLGAIHTAFPPMLDTTNPNPQTDLTSVWIGTNVESSQAWVYLAWARDSVRGSGVIMYEFQQNPQPSPFCDRDATTGVLLTPALCNPWASRTDEDFVIVWDQQGNNVSIILRRFVDIGGQLMLGPGIELTSLGFANASLSPDGSRGEAVVNLSQTVFSQATASCFSIANIIPGTVTGNSDSADYKDTVLFAFPPELTISSCGALIVRKVTGEGLTGTFPYTAQRDPSAPLRFPRDGGAYTLEGTLTGDHSEHGMGTPTIVGMQSHDKLVAADDYTLEELDIGTEWTLKSIMCQWNNGSKDVSETDPFFPVVINTTTICTITNEQNPGYLVVEKDVVNGYGLSMTADEFSYYLGVEDDEDPIAFLETGGETHEFPAGTDYNVLEVEVAGYLVTYSADCIDKTIEAGKTFTCTVKNEAQPNDPSLVTRQRVVAFDRVVISALRRSDTQAGGTVTFRAWSDEACSTLLGSTTVNVNYPGDTSIESVTVDVPTVNGVEIGYNQAGISPAFNVYWTVAFNGDNLNSSAESSCGTEITTITFKQ